MQTSKFDVDVNAAAAGLFSFSTAAAAAPHIVNICRRSRVLKYQILSSSTRVRMQFAPPSGKSNNQLARAAS
jgi:hypothetical protein